MLLRVRAKVPDSRRHWASAAAKSSFVRRGRVAQMLVYKAHSKKPHRSWMDGTCQPWGQHRTSELPKLDKTLHTCIEGLLERWARLPSSALVRESQAPRTAQSN